MGAVSARGSGTVLIVGILGAVMLLTLLLVPLLGLLAVAQGVQNAADAAALAAADTASGATAGFPCAVAEAAATLNEAAVTGCLVDGLIATVTVRRDYLGLPITARARAGPPPDGRAGIGPDGGASGGEVD